VSFGGFGGGSPMFGGGGGSRTAAAPGGGLPFAGIPPELQEGVNKLLDDEPEYPAPSAQFSYRTEDQSPKNLTLRSLVFKHWRLGAIAVLLVCIVSVTNQLGPALIAYAISHGMDHGRMSVVIACTALFLLAIVVTSVSQAFQARVSGRLASRVMNDLRIKVFTHLQRLGLGFYTQEKAGVIMTRMTSDIERLQQLLQDGLAQLVGQALTMVVITVILFTLNVELTLITLLLVIPLLTLGTIWFSRASEKAYGEVRERIADVLGDLSESLHGVRTVSAYNRQRWNIVDHRTIVGVDRFAGRLLPLPEPFLLTDPAAGTAIQHVPAGPVFRADPAVAVQGRPEYTGGGRRDRATAGDRGDRL
jgi:ATP-binding cassette, subfamily B, bacterial